MISKTFAAELKRRRRSLMRIMGDDSIAVIPSANVARRNRDSEYAFRQDSDFYYLTGFEEPECLMVLIPGRKAGQYIMFCRESDPLKEVWHGRRLGIESAPSALGADDAFPISDIDEILPGLLEGKKLVYHTLGKDQQFDSQLLGWLNQARSKWRAGAEADAFISLDYHLHEMRIQKSRNELALLKKAAQISAKGHKAAMQACKPGMHEYELEASLIHEYKKQGCTHAFLPIVGSGENGCILHYTENRSVLEDGQLVLVDSGAEYQYYAGDITRTFPVNGKFTAAQKTVYNIVLESQLAAIEAVVPGGHWHDPHQAVIKVLTQGLRDLGILKGSLASLIKEEAYKPYYMHSTGHWLGLDVHDVGEYKISGEWRLLEPGMVLTIEPGLYLNNSRKIPKKYRNIGIRIEDDVVVTKTGHDVLSSDIPKSIEKIESLMSAS